MPRSFFELTEQGLAWFGEHFGVPFGQERYDQVFVPDMGGAMENWGCVTWGDSVLFRSAPTPDQRRGVAEIAAARDGPYVVRRPGHHALVGRPVAQRGLRLLGRLLGRRRRDQATPTAGPSSWPTGKIEGYRVDMGPGTHPIRGEVDDVSQAMANFDAISYLKGPVGLKQLGAYAGDEAFLDGLRDYFREHAWGSTTLRGP